MVGKSPPYGQKVDLPLEEINIQIEKIQLSSQVELSLKTSTILPLLLYRYYPFFIIKNILYC